MGLVKKASQSRLFLERMEDFEQLGEPLFGREALGGIGRDQHRAVCAERPA